MQHAYLIIHPQLFIAVTTRCSANFRNATDLLLGRVNGDSTNR
jgi:hypothetical protein